MNYRFFVQGFYDSIAAFKFRVKIKEHRVSYATKLLSNYFYLNEVPLDAITTCKFNKYMGIYDQYVMQIVRNGNCITFLSNTLELSDDSFWNINYFEELTKYVFWTFNKSFLFQLIEKVQHLKISVIEHCIELLQQNLAPYNEPLDSCQDEELIWCYIKNERLKADSRFIMVYSLDEHNRKTLLQALENSIAEHPEITLFP